MTDRLAAEMAKMNDKELLMWSAEHSFRSGMRAYPTRMVKLACRLNDPIDPMDLPRMRPLLSQAGVTEQEFLANSQLLSYGATYRE